VLPVAVRPRAGVGKRGSALAEGHIRDWRWKRNSVLGQFVERAGENLPRNAHHQGDTTPAHGRGLGVGSRVGKKPGADHGLVTECRTSVWEVAPGIKGALGLGPASTTPGSATEGGKEKGGKTKGPLAFV